MKSKPKEACIKALQVTLVIPLERHVPGQNGPRKIRMMPVTPSGLDPAQLIASAVVEASQEALDNKSYHGFIKVQELKEVSL